MRYHGLKKETEDRDFLSLLSNCRLCPWECGVDRLNGELGRCRAGSTLKIAAHTIHTGEEPPISGKNGSGTVFFSHCNSFCIYCQNYPISQLGYGKKYSADDFIRIILNLQERGAHNINLVTPVPYTPLIKPSIIRARSLGLKIPVLMNLFGWETEAFAELTLDFVDVYLVDIRYSNNVTAERYSGVQDYTGVNERFLKKIYKLNPRTEFNEDGEIKSGIIIRHLVMPGLADESVECLNLLNNWFGNDVYLSLMNQYFPAYRSSEFPELNRKITEEEWEKVLNRLEVLGFKNGWIQEFHEDY